MKSKAASHLEVHDDGGMKGSDGEIQGVTPHFDGQCHAAKGWLPLELPRCFQVMILAGISV